MNEEPQNQPQNEFQNQQDVPIQTLAPTEPPKRKGSHTLLGVLLVILIVLGTGGGYWYGHKSQTEKAPSVVQKTASTSSTQAVAAPASSSVHFVQSLAYPLTGGNGTDGFQFLTKLGVPSAMQVVRIDSSIPNQGDGFQMFTDGTFNNELGRWDLGNPDYSGDGGSGASEISLIAITSNWLSTTGTTDWQDSDYTNRNSLQTPAQKQQFMTQLQTSTAACAKDASKGFKTKDGSLNVCYTYSYGHGAYGVYDPIIILTGYGNIDQQQMVLVGIINIYDPVLSAASGADKQTANQAASNGKVPASTAQLQKAIISALQQTTVTATPNTN